MRLSVSSLKKKTISTYKECIHGDGLYVEISIWVLKSVIRRRANAIIDGFENDSFKVRGCRKTLKT